MRQEVGKGQHVLGEMCPVAVSIATCGTGGISIAGAPATAVAAGAPATAVTASVSATAVAAGASATAATSTDAATAAA